MAPWQFYNGNGWSDEPADTYRIGNVAVSQQYGFFKQDSKYVLLTQEIWLSTKIYSYTCNTPGGPLNNKVPLYQTPVLYPGSFTYNAFPHIQFTSEANCWFPITQTVISGKSSVTWNSTARCSYVFLSP
jgi:hypothetical protein